MADTNVHVYIKTEGMKEMERQFEEAAIPNKPPKGIIELDNLFTAASAAVRSRVHVETGYLLASGRSDTHYVGDVWIAEIRYAADPGIFELARGDEPTKNHPTGGHFFFNAVDPFIPHMESTIDSMFDDYFSKAKV